MSEIKMIAFDLDGTLLTETKELTPRTRDILEKASEKGIELVVTTGRALSGVPDDVKSLSGCHYVITANGAGVYKRKETDSCELIAENLLDTTRARSLIAELSELEVMPDPFIDGKCYMIADKAYLVEKMDVSDDMKAYIRSSRTLIDDMDDFLFGKKVQKITINFASDEAGHRIDLAGVKDVLTRYPELVAVTGGIRNVEVSDKSATKGAALMKLARDLNIAPAEIIAFGDSENDVTMLQAAGCGVAMENALDVAKEAADAVTLSNDDEGVAAYLERII